MIPGRSTANLIWGLYRDYFEDPFCHYLHSTPELNKSWWYTAPCLDRGLFSVKGRSRAILTVHAFFSESRFPTPQFLAVSCRELTGLTLQATVTILEDPVPHHLKHANYSPSCAKRGGAGYHSARIGCCRMNVGIWYAVS